MWRSSYLHGARSLQKSDSLFPRILGVTFLKRSTLYKQLFFIGSERKREERNSNSGKKTDFSRFWGKKILPPVSFAVLLFFPSRLCSLPVKKSTSYWDPTGYKQQCGQHRKWPSYLLSGNIAISRIHCKCISDISSSVYVFSLWQAQGLHSRARVRAGEGKKSAMSCPVHALWTIIHPAVHLCVPCDCVFSRFWTHKQTYAQVYAVLMRLRLVLSSTKVVRLFLCFKIWLIGQGKGVKILNIKNFMYKLKTAATIVIGLAQGNCCIFNIASKWRLGLKTWSEKHYWFFSWGEWGRTWHLLSNTLCSYDSLRNQPRRTSTTMSQLFLSFFSPFF